MNWYFAISESSIDRPEHEWRDMIRVAVRSAIGSTDLKPHLLYDGGENPFLDELRGLGVTVIHRRVSFYDALEAYGANSPGYVNIASGAFLRFEIALIDDGEFALYTDCDVLFNRRLDFGAASKPPLFSASSQSSTNTSEDMNSGVMLINVAGMRAEYDALVAFTRANLDLGLDQEVLRVFCAGRYTPMDRSLNWKPYWGANPDAQIIHFHGPKPGAARRLASEGLGSTNIEIWKHLYSLSPEGYGEYVEAWDAVLAGRPRKSYFPYDRIDDPHLWARVAGLKASPGGCAP